MRAKTGGEGWRGDILSRTAGDMNMFYRVRERNHCTGEAGTQHDPMRQEGAGGLRGGWGIKYRGG